MRYRRADSSDRGVSAVFVALTVMIVGGFCALAINIGHLMMVRNQLQNAADSAALAAARSLDGTMAGIGAATAMAITYAGDHYTDQSSNAVVISPADVLFGRWDFRTPKASAFTAMTPSDANAYEINAVLVNDGRTQARGNPLDVFFSVFSGGQTTADTSRQAVAVGGAPCQLCTLPFVFADCLVLTGNTINCGQRIVMSNSIVNNCGFTNLEVGVQAVGTANIVSALRQCRSVGVGDIVGIENGNNLNKQVENALNDYINANGPQVVAPIVHVAAGCGAPLNFNGMMPIVGFATFTILGVQGEPHPQIDIQLDCEQTVAQEAPAGCGFFGTVSPRVDLVR